MFNFTWNCNTHTKVNLSLQLFDLNQILIPWLIHKSGWLVEVQAEERIWIRTAAKMSAGRLRTKTPHAVNRSFLSGNVSRPQKWGGSGGWEMGRPSPGESSSGAYRRGRFIVTSHPDHHTELSMERDETHLIIHHWCMAFIDELVSPSPAPLRFSSHSRPVWSTRSWSGFSSLHVCTWRFHSTLRAPPSAERLTGVSVCRRRDRQRLGADLKCQQLLEGFLSVRGQILHMGS